MPSAPATIKDACKAAFRRDLDWIRALHARGLNFNDRAGKFGVNKSSLFGWTSFFGPMTPLAIAILRHDVETVKYLIEIIKVDPFLTSGRLHDWLPMDCAKKKAKDCPDTTEIIKLLEDYQANYYLKLIERTTQTTIRSSNTTVQQNAVTNSGSSSSSGLSSSTSNASTVIPAQQATQKLVIPAFVSELSQKVEASPTEKTLANGNEVPAFNKVSNQDLYRVLPPKNK